MSHKPVHPTLLFALLMAASMLYSARPALAQVDQMMPPTGGPGGGQYSARCALDEILNGFELRTGDDVDGIRAVCAKPHSPTAIGPRNLHPSSTGGTGGGVVRVVCPDNTPSIAGVLVGWEGVDTYIVNNLRLYCAINAVNQQPAPHPTVGFDGPEITGDDSKILSGKFSTGIVFEMQRCPGGLVPVGIHGRSGIWLDSVGLICGALPLETPATPKPAAPGKPKITASTTGPFRILVEWMAPVPASFIEWYSIELWKGQRWVTLPTRFDPRRFQGFVDYPDVDAAQRQAFRVCAVNAAHKSCSTESWYHSFAKGKDALTAPRSPASAVPPRPIEVRPGATIGSARAAPPGASTNYIPGAAVQSASAPAISAPPVDALTNHAPDFNALAARGSAVAMQDPLTAELRRRTAPAALRGFDIGMAAAEGQSLPGPGKQKIHDALTAAEQPGFDAAVAFSLQRNRNAKLAAVGAAIAAADPVVARARVAENDVVYSLGFDIASGIFGDPKAGAQGNTATGSGSLGLRNSLSPAAQRGFNAATALHLSRQYR